MRVELLHSLYTMKREKTKIWYSLALTTFMLLQVSFHTYHVFTSHVSDVHIENSASDTQIHEASFACELCAKLSGKTYYLFFVPVIFHLIIGVSPKIYFRKSLFFCPSFSAYSLRGPPFNY
ncbi:hypothetical protein [Spongiimicrobium sp. 3-5]|uniref:hypothetical protein n=1 Tax=Spongiimicrobium sp. 3-5 TaxID=3332596 RepID=UPI003980B14B